MEIFQLGSQSGGAIYRLLGKIRVITFGKVFGILEPYTAF